MTLRLAHTRRELDTTLRAGPGQDGGATRIVLVPTMGALHAGHAALIRQARQHGSVVVVSIFVNPTQFGPDEDFDRYPRDLQADLAVCEAAGADVVFAPGVDEVYPGGDLRVSVDPGTLGDELEGAVRQGHFRGVLTVVAKLLGLVRPDAVVLGQKDYQQLVLVRRMVLDLCLAVDVHGIETVREDDGLAMSSRNRYLATDERGAALALSRALTAGADATTGGAAAVLAAVHQALDEAPGVALDYVALRAPDLGPAPDHGDARLLVAARVGSTRLIDNMCVRLPDTLGPGPGPDEEKG